MFNLDELAWTIIDGTAVFLDIAQDRYFRLPDACNREFVAAQARRDLDFPVQPMCLPRPATWTLPATVSPDIDHGPFRLGEIARAIWMQRRIERRLESRSFHSVINEVRHVVADRDYFELGSKGARVVRAFEQARLLRSTADRCLPRSIALALCLAARQCRVHVVLGVKLAPFAAHCWVQDGGAVLNDSLEEVQRYSPILVV
ncbi:lasso peptide biosynthesis B2 protein [Novosphingobium sp.]|uniref:lasso peptide biosynthesis B2 protein n=1 Tax=Novosphingobium sp. TaxID=1874826 RepID=UPI00286EB25E|nr:lasso peptide biosynthesis B2 protein [Novosphingobium sp.]